MASWITTIVSTAISAASLIVAIASAAIAKSSLTQARLAVEEQKVATNRAQMNWIQQKWFDLYLKVDQAHNALEYYQFLYQHNNAATPSAQQLLDANRVIHQFREACTMAVVFPENEAIDAVFETTDFRNRQNLLSPERLKAVADALELLRERALVDASVLEPKTQLAH